MPFDKQLRKMLTGGINLLPPSDIIDEDQASKCVNWRVDQLGALRSRAGATLLYSGLGGYVHSIHRMDMPGGEKRRYCGVDQKLYRDGVEVVVGFSGEQLGMCSYDGNLWIINRSLQGRDDGTAWKKWLPDPPVKPTATAAEGVLVGTIQYYITFLTDESYESNPSQPSDPVELTSPGGVTLRFDWPADPYVTKANIYRVGGKLPVPYLNPYVKPVRGTETYWEGTDSGGSSATTDVMSQLLDVWRAYPAFWANHTNTEISVNIILTTFPSWTKQLRADNSMIHITAACEWFGLTADDTTSLTSACQAILQAWVDTPDPDPGDLTDEGALIEYGVILEDDHDPPPPAAVMAPNAYFNRLVAGCSPDHPNRIWWTPSAEPWYFRGSGSDDGDWLDVGELNEEVVALSPKPRMLIIYKEHSVWRVTGDLEGGTLEQTNSDTGLIGRKAWAPQGLVDYIQGKEGIYLFNGDVSVKFSEKVDPIFKGAYSGKVEPTRPIDPARRKQAVMAVKHERLYFSYPEV